MKICKVTITKKISGGDSSCSNVWPRGHDPVKINIINYEDDDWDDGDNVSHAIGLVDDDFTFTADMVEINRTEAEASIDATAAYEEIVVSRKDGMTAEDATATRVKRESRKRWLPV